MKLCAIFWEMDFEPPSTIRFNDSIFSFPDKGGNIECKWFFCQSFLTRCVSFLFMHTHTYAHPHSIWNTVQFSSGFWGMFKHESLHNQIIPLDALYEKRNNISLAHMNESCNCTRKKVLKLRGTFFLSLLLYDIEVV